MNKTWTRWAPAALVPAVVVAGAITIPASAGAAVALPEKSAQEVLELIAEGADATYSGTVEQRSDLGLPDLPTTGQSADAGTALEFLTGTHSLRVFVGDDAERLQVIDQLAERDVVRNGDDLWLYSSRDQEATHLTLPAEGDRTVSGTPPTPSDVADRLVTAVEPSTEVTVGENARVAGRAAYAITLTPRTDDTLVDSATVSVDAETGLPLSVRVMARGQQEPAFSVGFTDIDFTAPDANLFDFTPPAGATVSEEQLPERGTAPDVAKADHPRPTVTGEGWGAIVSFDLGDSAPSAPDSEAAATPDQLTTRVEGGQIVETSLVSILLTDDGRVLAGAVPADALLAAAE